MEVCWVYDSSLNLFNIEFDSYIWWKADSGQQVQFQTQYFIDGDTKKYMNNNNKIIIIT